MLQQAARRPPAPVFGFLFADGRFGGDPPASMMVDGGSTAWGTPRWGLPSAKRRLAKFLRLPDMTGVNCQRQEDRIRIRFYLGDRSAAARAG
jgi:hypothetical protein